jgi:hypothetical protein
MQHTDPLNPATAGPHLALQNKMGYCSVQHNVISARGQPQALHALRVKVQSCEALEAGGMEAGGASGLRYQHTAADRLPTS